MIISMARLSFFIIIFFTIVLASPAQAVNTPIIAKAVVVKGAVTIYKTKEKFGRRVIVGTSFAEGDRIATGEDSAVEIEFDTGSRIRLDQSSKITMQSLHRNESGSATSIFDLAVGKVRSFVTKLASADSKFEYHTKTAIAGVAGTDFVVEVPDENSMVVYVIPDDVEPGEEESGVCQDSALWDDGVVYVKGFDSEETSVDVLSCFMTTIISGMAPGRPVLIPDSILFGAITNLPFSGAKPAAVIMQEQAMMENIARRVSVPLKTGDPMDGSLQRLDRQYDQGQGTSTGGGGSGGSGGGSKVSPVVTGEITINIGL